MNRRVAAGVLLLLVALACAGSARPATPPVPATMRYTGWLVPGPGGSPRHLVFEGDGPMLEFTDAWNLTRTPTRYRVCVFEGGVRKYCENGRAPLSTTPSSLPLRVSCCGTFVAKWYVAGRVVATWSFLYRPED